MAASVSTDAPLQADKAHAQIGMVHALPIEVGAWLNRCEKVRQYAGPEFRFRGGRYQGLRVALAEAGIGFARARRATHALIDAHTPEWVLSVGFSGALQVGLRVGDLVVGTELCDLHGQKLSVGLQMPHDPERGLHVGRLLTADHLVRTSREKLQLGADSGALAVDLESLAVAQVCVERKTRFLAVRVISDDAATDLPAEVLTVLGGTGSVRVGAVLGALWRRPACWSDLLQMRETALQAADRLADFLHGIVMQLPTSATPDTPPVDVDPVG